MLYSQFGHSAIGVVDPELDLNTVFNYGTFSFNTPNFYLKFCAGKLLYRLSTESFPHFISDYEEDGRSVIVQRLNLTLEQRQKLFDNLDENYKPENRYYQYDFFFDNCASRILDILYLSFGGAITYCDTSTSCQPTLRDCIHPYLQGSKWTQAGIDLALGSITDHEANKRQQAFLPDKLHDYLTGCMIDSLPLVTEDREIVESSIEYDTTPWPIAPVTIFGFLLLLVISTTIFCAKRNLILFDRIFFCFIGVLGLIISLLWFATDHGATVWNFNVLWASPLYLVYIFILGKRPKKWHSCFVLVLIISNALMLPAAFIQHFNICFYILAAIAVLRLCASYKRLIA